jgi:N utilization substance protein A
MHPEQLEQIPGIGPKTVEKISVAVNNYFSSIEGASATGQGDDAAAASGELLEPPAEEAGEALQTGPDSAGQSGDNSELSDVAEMAPESVAELEETEQSYEAEVISGVENAPPADEAEVHTHEENSGEDRNAPEEK